MLLGLLGLQFRKLVRQNKLNDPPGLKEIDLRVFQMALNKPMNALGPRCNKLLEVEVLVNPSLDEFLFIGIQPGLHDIAHLFNIHRKVALLPLLEPLVIYILGR
jgi:hypothetical protein